MQTSVTHVVPPIVETIHLERILVASDLQPNSTRALIYAAEVARRFGSELIVAHVVDRPFPDYTPHEESHWAELLLKAKAKLQEQVGKLRDIRVTVLVRLGDIGIDLKTLITQVEPGLVILGTHARTGAKRLVLGSVAEEIFRSSGVPVFTVAPSHSKARGTAVLLNRILLPLDHTLQSEAAIPVAFELAKRFGSKLYCLHVADFSESEKEAQDRMKAMVLPYCRGLRFPVFRVTTDTKVANAILREASKMHADLIVMGVRESPEADRAATHWPWAIAAEVTSHASCPVVTVRAKQNAQSQAA